jgi:hypothetical protein
VTELVFALILVVVVEVTSREGLIKFETDGLVMIIATVATIATALLFSLSSLSSLFCAGAVAHPRPHLSGVVR